MGVQQPRSKASPAVNLGSRDDGPKNPKCDALCCGFKELLRAVGAGGTRRAWDELSVAAVLSKELYSSTAAPGSLMDQGWQQDDVLLVLQQVTQQISLLVRLENT